MLFTHTNAHLDRQIHIGVVITKMDLLTQDNDDMYKQRKEECMQCFNIAEDNVLLVDNYHRGTERVIDTATSGFLFFFSFSISFY